MSSVVVLLNKQVLKRSDSPARGRRMALKLGAFAGVLAGAMEPFSMVVALKLRPTTEELKRQYAEVMKKNAQLKGDLAKKQKIHEDNQALIQKHRKLKKAHDEDQRRWLEDFKKRSQENDRKWEEYKKEQKEQEKLEEQKRLKDEQEKLEEENYWPGEERLSELERVKPLKQKSEVTLKSQRTSSNFSLPRDYCMWFCGCGFADVFCIAIIIGCCCCPCSCCRSSRATTSTDQKKKENNNLQKTNDKETTEDSESSLPVSSLNEVRVIKMEV